MGERAGVAVRAAVHDETCACGRVYMCVLVYVRVVGYGWVWLGVVVCVCVCKAREMVKTMILAPNPCNRETPSPPHHQSIRQNPRLRFTQIKRK